jgi:hypothetical protein
MQSVGARVRLYVCVKRKSFVHCSTGIQSRQASSRRHASKKAGTQTDVCVHVLCALLPNTAGPVSAGTIVKDRYTVKEVLGRGANAITYLATDNTSGNPVSHASSSNQLDAALPTYTKLKPHAQRGSSQAVWQLMSLCSLKDRAMEQWSSAA